MKISILSLILFTLISCTNHAQNIIYEKVVKEDVFNNKQIYKAEGNEILQVLGINALSKTELDYVLFIYNKKNKRTCQIVGKAIKKEGDMEFDEDEFGNSIPVNEYIDNKDCWISIRVNNEDGSTASIIAAECKEDKLLPYSSIGLMKKQNN